MREGLILLGAYAPGVSKNAELTVIYYNEERDSLNWRVSYKSTIGRMDKLYGRYGFKKLPKDNTRRALMISWIMRSRGGNQYRKTLDHNALKALKYNIKYESVAVRETRPGSRGALRRCVNSRHRSHDGRGKEYDRQAVSGRWRCLRRVSVCEPTEPSVRSCPM